MSQIIDLIPALREIFEFIKKINEKIKDTNLKLDVEPDEIFNAIESYNREKNNNIEQIKSNKNEIDKLNSKIFQTTQEIPRSESRLSELSDQYQEIHNRFEIKRKELEDIKAKLIDSKKEYGNQSDYLNELESEINESWKKVEEKIQELSKLEEKQNQDLVKIKTESEQDIIKLKNGFEEELMKYETEYKQEYDELLEKCTPIRIKINAMKLLIKNGFIDNELYEFINSLEINKPLELNLISQIIKIEPEKIKNILKKMIELNGSIDFDEKSEVITLRKEVDFK